MSMTPDEIRKAYVKAALQETYNKLPMVDKVIHDAHVNVYGSPPPWFVLMVRKTTLKNIADVTQENKEKETPADG